MNVNDQTFAAFANANEERKKSLLQYVSEGARNADLEAAGYTPAEVAAAFPPTKPVVASKEFDRDRQAAPKEITMMQQTTPTLRDNFRENVRRGASALGADDQYAQFISGRIAGTGGDLGLIDATGLGVIPGVQEGVQQAKRGYKTGSDTDIAMGALNTGLNVLAAVPGGKLIAKGITKGVEKLAEKAVAASDTALVQSLDVPIEKTTEALKPSYKPTMFRTSDTGKIEVNPNSLMEFYSPTVETVRNVEFPAKGYKGSELLKFLKEKAPGVRKTEVDALDLKLDPQKRYTREEALAEVEKKSYKVYAEEVDDTTYKSSQRQDISDPEISFSTIKINATREGDTFMPSHGYTHYDPETIAHSRNSIREDAQGRKYLLVEEVQSDLVQAGSAKTRGALTRDEAYDEAISQGVKSLGKDPKKFLLYKKDQKFYDSVFKTSSEDARILALKTKGVEVPKEELDNLEKLRAETQALSRNHNYDDELYSAFDDFGYGESRSIDRRMKAKAPLTDDADAVRLALQSAMAKADESDVTSIVIPNLQRIVTAQGRGARYGTEKYDKYMKAGSGFQKTYVDGVDSFIAQLKKEYGDAIKIEQIELPYRSKTTFYSDAMSGRDVPLDNSAIKIDFSGLKGVNLRSGQFAEGGLVGYAEGGTVEDEQMNRLMEEGGMTDAGVAQEPVTGNEVPPGALPSEVRDDVPVQLSEGEYVVPADVLRFFGMRFFEDLRNQAKQGLAEMQSSGRIGGASVDSNGVPTEDDDDELTPEEEQMLQAAMGSQEVPAGMAEGGVVPFDRSKFTLSNNTSERETRKYIDPTTGITQMFQFFMGSPVSPIPTNFVPWTQELETTAAAKPTTPTITAPPVAPARSDRESTMAAPAGATPADGGGINYNNWAEKNYADITTNPYQFGVDALTDQTGKFGSKVVGGAGLMAGNLPLAALGMGIKAGNKIQNIAEANASLKIMEAQNLQGSTDYKNLKKLTDAAIDDLPGLQKIAVKNGLLATGNEYAEPIIKKLKTGVDTPAATTPVAPVKLKAPAQDKSGIQGQTAPLTSPLPPKNPTRSDNGNGQSSKTTTPTKAQVAQYTSSNATTPTKTTTPTKAQVAQYTSSNATTPTKTSDSGPKKGAAGRATGGLITKPQKTTPKTKGLAGKQ
jgi:hypothetical protein